MSFEWHGRGTADGKVWEQEITRYCFISGEEVITQAAHGPVTTIRVGTRLKLTKSEAHKFFKHGIVEFHTTVWDEKTGRYNRTIIPLTEGRIGMDKERRVLYEYECSPEDVAPPKRKKKVDIIPPV